MSVPDRKILMVVTSHDCIDVDHPTGLWLEEFAVPWQIFRAAGISVTVASPLGGAAPLDPRSLEDDARVAAWAEARSALMETMPLRTLPMHRFDAVFLVGGHGTMFDFPECPELQVLLRTHFANGSLVAAVCHGPAGLVGVDLDDGSPLVAGRRLTAFTDAEERAVELDGLMPFLLESELRERGADFVAGEAWRSHVEIDGNLITGQNPASSAAAAEAVLQRLPD
ncbi:putative intracellular protease/amidase [Geothermobacter ehrlichii]|uniref:Putative intracellular protease/amidase n=1 Tax=Geothermobacter ehrlichii TaxID=213224 RepID=A0A5D3WH65_9BACT|nr:type 1 glutamine amidotransferase domain-containing protein [Geothermobacter ehrlichii]TYO98166.1 putative intracellular protease/amidase [Geothermobacter ehrlichii]